MIALIESIVDVIKRDVLDSLPLLEAVSAGDDILKIPDSGAYPIGAELAIIADDDCKTLHLCRVACRLDNQQIRIEPPVPAEFAIGATVQPMIEGQIVRHVTIGNPSSIPNFPAVTVEESDKTNEPLTLGTFSETHNLTIRVWAETATYESSLRLVHRLADKIEYALFKTAFPLIQPYLCSTLSVPVLTSDETTITIADENMLTGATQAYLQDSFGLRKPIWIAAALGGGTYQLTMPVGGAWPIGSKVIRPLVHCYDALCQSISYGDGRDGGTLLQFARLDYSLKIARTRYAEPLG